MNPDAPLALRLSGQLMLGVVRIYSRKVNYLFQDCSEALVKIKQAFKPGGRDDVDLPEGAETAPLGAITLPENYDDLELFFEPGGAFGAQATHPSGGDDDGREGVDDITLERANPFEMEDDFDRFYAYDDRVHGDVGDDDAFIEDELDPRLHPEPGFRVGDGPRAYGESDPNERVDAEGVGVRRRPPTTTTPSARRRPTTAARPRPGSPERERRRRRGPAAAPPGRRPGGRDGRAGHGGRVQDPPRGGARGREGERPRGGPQHREHRRGDGGVGQDGAEIQAPGGVREAGAA